MRYFCSELTIQQFEALLRGKQAENDKELDAAATRTGRRPWGDEGLRSMYVPRP